MLHECVVRSDVCIDTTGCSRAAYPWCVAPQHHHRPQRWTRLSTSTAALSSRMLHLSAICSTAGWLRAPPGKIASAPCSETTTTETPKLNVRAAVRYHLLPWQASLPVLQSILGKMPISAHLFSLARADGYLEGLADVARCAYCPLFAHLVRGHCGNLQRRSS